MKPHSSNKSSPMSAIFLCFAAVCVLVDSAKAAAIKNEGHESGNPPGDVEFVPIKRHRPGRGLRDFHEDIFDYDFGEFTTLKRNSPESHSTEANRHEATAGKSKVAHDVAKLKGTQETLTGRDLQQMPSRQVLHKRSASHPRPSSKLAQLLQKRMGDMNMNGFHGDTFSDGFGGFSTAKRGFGVDAFHGDTFSDGFGSFSTSKRAFDDNAFHGDTFSDGFGSFNPTKRGFGPDAFHGDTFSDGFGSFSTTKRGFNNDAFHGDTFSDGFGGFSTSKRGFGQDAFHGDTFSDGFGDFSTAKRSFGQDAFHGDTFSDGFGDFAPTKRFDLKRTMGNDAFHGDTFSDGFGEFTTF